MLPSPLTRKRALSMLQSAESSLEALDRFIYIVTRVCQRKKARFVLRWWQKYSLFQQSPVDFHVSAVVSLHG
jgi:hypothetical protein